MTVKTLTIREVIEAGAKNGYLWSREGAYVRNEDGITHACWIGQAALNLKVSAKVLDIALLRRVDRTKLWITVFNDLGAQSYNEVTEYAKELFADALDELIELDILD